MKCPLYRDFLIRIWPGKRSVPRFTVRIIEMSALWCVRLIEIRLYKKKFRVQKNIEFHDFTVSNEIISATKQEFFLYQSSPRTKHNWHCTNGFFIGTALRNVYFILHYHLFFRKEFFFECLYFSDKIFECSYLSFGWEIDHPLSMSLTRVMEGVHPKCL